MGQMISHQCTQNLEFFFAEGENRRIETEICNPYPVDKLKVFVFFDGGDDLRFVVSIYKRVLGLVSYVGTTADQDPEKQLKDLQTIKPWLKESTCPDSVLNLLDLYLRNLQKEIARAKTSN